MQKSKLKFLRERERERERERTKVQKRDKGYQHIIFFSSKIIVLKAPKLYKIKEEEWTKSNSLFHLQSNQSMKSKRDKKVDPIYTLTHCKNIYIEKHKIA